LATQAAVQLSGCAQSRLPAGSCSIFFCLQGALVVAQSVLEKTPLLARHAHRLPQPAAALGNIAALSLVPDFFLYLWVELGLFDTFARSVPHLAW